MKEDNNPRCVFCGSSNVWKAGYKIKSSPYRKVQRYQCKDCGRYFDEEAVKRKIATAKNKEVSER